MKTKFIVFFSILSLLLFGCRKKCDSITEKPLKGKMENYFGAYKEGNWWVYANKSNTKKDSIYLGDFTDKFVKNLTNCESNQTRKFIIHSSYLVEGISKLYATYEAGGSRVHIYFSFNPGTTVSAGFPFFTDFSNEGGALQSFDPDSSGKNLYDSITLNGQTYNNILVGRDGTVTYYFGNGKGIVGWGNILDTFNLINFKIL